MKYSLSILATLISMQTFAQLEGNYKIELNVTTPGERIHCMDQISELDVEIMVVNKNEATGSYSLIAQIESLDAAEKLEEVKCVESVKPTN